MIDILIAAALAQSDGDRPDWRSIHAGNRGEVFVDRGSFRRLDHGMFEITTRAVFARPERSGLAISISVNAYDCRRRTFALRSVRPVNADGVIFAARWAQGPQAYMHPVPYGTPNDTILNEYCQRALRPVEGS